jgi:peroxiredoxin
MTAEQKNLVRGVALAVTVGVAVYFVTMDLSSGPGRRAAPGLQAGTQAPTFSLPSIRGDGPIDLAALRGKGVLLAFWATWCDSCQHELPVLDRIHRDLAGPDLQVVTVAGEARGDLERFVKARGWVLPVAADGGQVHAEYGVHGLPRTLVISPEGRILEDHLGPLSPSKLTDTAKRLSACAAASRSGVAEDPWCAAGVPPSVAERPPHAG